MFCQMRDCKAGDRVARKYVVLVGLSLLVVAKVVVSKCLL